MHTNVMNCGERTTLRQREPELSQLCVCEHKRHRDIEQKQFTQCYFMVATNSIRVESGCLKKKRKKVYKLHLDGPTGSERS